MKSYLKPESPGDTDGKVGGCLKSMALFKDQKSGTYGYFYSTLRGVNSEIPQGTLLS